MNFALASSTDIGLKKETNQDAFLVELASTEESNICLASLCDGMGGLAKGELASAVAVRAQDVWLRNTLPPLLKSGDIEAIAESLRQVAIDENARIGAFGHKGNFSLGTTFTSLLIIENSYLIIHVGDSRIYHLSNGELHQVTKDQSLVQLEVDRGLITADEAELDSRRNVLLQCVGASKKVVPDVLFGECCVGDSFLLCSDGFRHELSDDEFASSLISVQHGDEDDASRVLTSMINLCKERGELDNITAVLVMLV